MSEPLDIEKFNPTVAEITKLVEGAKGLAISGIDDKAGYLAVHDARIALKNARITIEKKCKEARAEAQAYSKAVIAKEHELVGLISPTEDELQKMQDDIDHQKVLVKRRESMPGRIERLGAIDIVVDAEADYNEILEMDDAVFEGHYNRRHGEWLAKKEAALKAEREAQEAAAAAERERIATEEREAKERREAEARAAQAKIDEENARVKAEQDAKAAALKAESDRIEAEKRAMAERKSEEERERLRQEAAEKQRKLDAERAEADKKAAIEKAVADEKARIERETAEKAEREAKEQARLTAEKRYQDFLAANPHDRVIAENGAVILYKEVARMKV